MTSFRFNERLCFKGIKQTVTEQNTKVLLWPLLNSYADKHVRLHKCIQYTKIAKIFCTILSSMIKCYFLPIT